MVAIPSTVDVLGFLFASLWYYFIDSIEMARRTKVEQESPVHCAIDCRRVALLVSLQEATGLPTSAHTTLPHTQILIVSDLKCQDM